MSTKSRMAAVSLSPLREYCYYLVLSSNIREKERRLGKQSPEDMILALAGQFKQLSHEPEKFR